MYFYLLNKSSITIKNGTIKWKIFVLILLFFVNFSDGGQKKKQKGKNVQSEGTDHSEGGQPTMREKANEEMGAKNGRRCPQKGSAKWGVVKPIGDPLAVEAMTNFVDFSHVDGDEAQLRVVGLALRTNFIVWFLKRNVGEMLDMADTLLHQLDATELAPCIERKVWQEIEQLVANERNKVIVCILYKFGLNAHQFMHTFGLATSAWFDLLRKLHMLDIFAAHMDFSIDCGNSEEVEKINQFLFGVPTLNTIIAQNIGEFLKVSASFRHFFCHEIDILALKMQMNAKLLSSSNLVHLEDEFPEVLRIDLTLTTTIFERCRAMLLNRSNSDEHRRAYTHWAMGWLIGKLRQVRDQIVAMPQLVLSAQAVVTLHKTVEEQCSKALDEMMSERQMCVLERLNDFMTHLRAKVVRQFEKQFKKVAKAEECGDERRRTEMLAHFRSTLFSRTIAVSINASISKKNKTSELFLQMLNSPGAKTRLLKLLGNSKERMAELKDEQGQLMTRFYEEDVFFNDDRLFDHYGHVLAADDNDEWFRFSSKLGADVAVFMRWVKRETAERGLGPHVYRQMRIYVDEHIYDPLFDGTTTEQTEGAQQFLGKMFFYTKKLLEIIGGIGEGGEADKFWQKWREFVADGGQKMIELPSEVLQGNWEWMGQLHLREFVGLMEGLDGGRRHLTKFNNVLNSTVGTRIMEGLLNFFDQPTIFGIFQRLGLNHQILQYPFVQNYQNSQFMMLKVLTEETITTGSSDSGEAEAKSAENDRDKTSKNQFEMSVKNEQPVENAEAENKIGPDGEGDNDWADEESAEQYFKRMTSKKGARPTNEEAPEQLLLCPPKSVSMEVLQEIDGANNSTPLMHFLLAQLMEFLCANHVPLLHFKNGKHMLKLQMYALLWYLSELAAKLIKLAKEMKPLADEPQQQKRRAVAMAAEVAKLSAALAQLTAVTTPNSGADQRPLTDPKAVDRRLFRLYRFLVHIAFNKVLTENGIGWPDTIERETEFGTEFGLFKGEDPAKSDQWETVPFDDSQMLSIYLQFADPSDQLLESTFYFVYDLLVRFTALQRFFCALTDTEQLRAAKARLQMAMGEQCLGSLDKLFPEIMQFDVPLSLTASIWLKFFLAHKRDTGASQHAEALLALPHLLMQAKQKVDRMAASGITQHIPATWRRKLRSVRRMVYKSLVQNEEGKFLHNLCVVYLFCTLLDKAESFQLKTYKKHGVFHPGKVREQFEELDTCARDDVQQQTFRQQRATLAPILFAFLSIFFKTDAFLFSDFLKDFRGTRSRLKWLFGDSSSLYATLMQKYRPKIMDPQIFHGEQLQQLYWDALFGEDIGTLVVGKLSVFIAVLVRWMDAQLLADRPDITLGLRQVGNTVWRQKTRPFFEDMFDELVDYDLDELERKGYMLKELIKSLLRFVEQKRNERDLDKLDMRRASLFARRGKKKSNMIVKTTDNALVAVRGNNLTKEWEGMVADALERAGEAGRTGTTTGEEETEQEEQQLFSWIHRTQWETIVELLEHERDRAHFKKNLILHAGSGERLTYFVSVEMANEILALLNLEDKNDIEAKLKEMKERYGKEKKEKGDKEKREEKEQKELADRNMNEMIREEEERMRELKTRIEKMQREKQKRKAEQREREWERREKEGGAKDSVKGETAKKKGNESKQGNNNNERKVLEEGNAEKKRKEKALKKESVGEKQTEESEQNETAEKRESDKETEEGENLRIELAQVELDDFRSDSFLESKYFEFLKNPSKTKKELLHIGAFVNEIRHRIETSEGMSQIYSADDGTQRQKIEREKGNLGELTEKRNSKIGIFGLKQKLCDLLKRIVTDKDGWGNGSGNGGDTVEDQRGITVGGDGAALKAVLTQLHKNKMAKAIIEGSEQQGQSHCVSCRGDIWQKMDERTKKGTLSLIFDTNEKTKANLMSRFNEHIENWRSLLGQQNLDKELFGQFSRDMGQSEESNSLTNVHGMHEHMQQIYFQYTDYKQHDKMLKQILEENGYGGQELPGDLMDEIKTTISKWSNGDDRLIVTGSHLLGTQTPGSDIDIICIVPQKLSYSEERQKFFGTSMSNCDLTGENSEAEGAKCADESLFCQFCKNPKMEEITKIWSSYIKMLQLKLAGIKFDLSFVLIPGMEYLPDEPLDADDIEWMMEVLANQQRAPWAMLRALSSYLANQAIIAQLNSKKREKFKTLSLALKFWAKNHYIYGNIHGFFNGISLSILATKIILLYPNASVLFLLERLLFIFTIWNWPMPVKLTDAAKHTGLFETFSWHLSQEETPTVPIITPSILSQNCTYNINKATLKIIQKAMRETLFQLKIFKNSSTKNSLINVLSGEVFTEKYRHFAVISCIVSTQAHIAQFCQFVERKIRLKMAHFDELTDGMVEYGHVRPTGEFANRRNGKCPATVDVSDFAGSSRTALCQIWLVGLQLNGQIKNLDGENKEKINEKLSSELDTKIFKEYESEVLKGWFQHVRLRSTYVDVEELAEWNLISICPREVQKILSL